MKIRESRLSAHHNYLVNRMLTPGFLVGDPRSEKSFYFLADVVLPGESTPRISCRFMNEQGEMLAEMGWNRIRNNPGSCVFMSTPGGFRILSPGQRLDHGSPDRVFCQRLSHAHYGGRCSTKTVTRAWRLWMKAWPSAARLNGPSPPPMTFESRKDNFEAFDALHLQ